MVVFERETAGDEEEGEEEVNMLAAASGSSAVAGSRQRANSPCAAGSKLRRQCKFAALARTSCCEVLARRVSLHIQVWAKSDHASHATWEEHEYTVHTTNTRTSKNCFM